MKRVLILDMHNAARSIMAEALINHYLKEGCQIYAESAGLDPKGSVEIEALRALVDEGIATERLYSKGLEEIKDLSFDLAVTVCDHAKGLCPTLPQAKKEIHIALEDPQNGPYEAYVRELHQLRNVLLPKIREELCD